MNCDFCLFVYFGSVKNVIGNLIGIVLNLYIALGSMVIFTILILPRTWFTFPSVYVIFDFFHQYLRVFYMQLFCLLRTICAAQQTDRQVNS